MAREGVGIETDAARLSVVAEHVVHPVLLGGWWLRSPSPRRNRMKLHGTLALSLNGRRRLVRMVIKQGRLITEAALACTI